MRVKLKNVTDQFDKIPRSLDLELVDGTRQTTIELDYLRCTNLCIVSRSDEVLKNLSYSISNGELDRARVLVVDTNDKIDEYINIIKEKLDIPYLVIIDLNKISPLYIADYLIESPNVGVNVILLLNSKDVIGGFFMLPFSETLNNKDYVNGIINLDALPEKGIINTTTFI